MRQFYLSYKQVKHGNSLLRTYAVICGRFNLAVNRDYMHAQNEGKLASVCLQQFSSIFETTVIVVSKMHSNEVIEQVKHDYYAVICGTCRFNITVN